MGIAGDLLAGLEKLDIWRRMRDTAERIPALEARIAELEQKLGNKWPPDVCKKCGERTLRMAYSRPEEKGIILQRWSCASGTCPDEWRRAKE